MTLHLNELGQPIGAPLDHWQACKRPAGETLYGQYCRLETIDLKRHSADLWQAFNADKQQRIWTYLSYGPFASQTQFEQWIAITCCVQDPLFYVVIDLAKGKALGLASYLRIQPEIGLIEVGHINFSPALQQTTAATEAMYLMMKQAFELGYRRYEWKCDNANLGSKRAAERLGFSHDGLFEQATMYKGRNRDTAWFSVLDHQWQEKQLAFLNWLSVDNFDAEGKQRKPLQALG